ncbi:MAG: hypothetical protein ACRD1C_08805 [Terriglobales bacterium]
MEARRAIRDLVALAALLLLAAGALLELNRTLRQHFPAVAAMEMLWHGGARK